MIFCKLAYRKEILICLIYNIICGKLYKHPLSYIYCVVHVAVLFVFLRSFTVFIVKNLFSIPIWEIQNYASLQEDVNREASTLLVVNVEDVDDVHTVFVYNKQEDLLPWQITVGFLIVIIIIGGSLVTIVIIKLWHK